MLNIQTSFNAIRFQGKSLLEENSTQQAKTASLNNNLTGDSVNLDLKFSGKSNNSDVKDSNLYQDTDIKNSVAQYTQSFKDAILYQDSEKCNEILKELTEAPTEIKTGFASYRKYKGKGTQLGDILTLDKGIAPEMKEVATNYIKFLETLDTKTQNDYAASLCHDIDMYFFNRELSLDHTPQRRKEIASDILSYIGKNIQE